MQGIEHASLFVLQRLLPVLVGTMFQQYLAQGLPASQAAKKAAGETGVRKSEIYRWLAEKKEETDG